ncbi:MAG: hypothetical protein ACOX7J_06670 [Bacillota bacterium]
MKKKFLLLTLVGIIALGLFGCGNAEPATPPDLTGEWKQVNSASETAYQSANIQGDIIEIYWIDEDTDTKSLYWAGTFIAPTTPDEPYTWDSANDTEKTDSSLMASTAPTKTITYENGQISYDASALGVTQTVKLEKEDTK